MDGIQSTKDRMQDVLDGALRAGSRCAWVDFPNYTNVGDSAIWLGELDYVRSRDVSIAYLSDIKNYDPSLMRDRFPCDCVVLHGGGNFGDIWPGFQAVRQQIIGGFRDTPIIQFPQSIFFESIDRLNATRSVIKEHSRFVLLVRDMKSLEVATEHFDCTVRLCPDMAFAMSSARIKRFAPKDGVKVVYLSRSDKESSGNKQGRVPEGVVKVDWAGRHRSKFSRYYRITNRAESIRLVRKFFPLYRVRLLIAERLAMDRLEMGCRLLCQAERVVTDRLHGMILASMLGLRVYAFDNSYGKLSSYYEAWGDWLPNVAFCRDEAEALDAALS